jgi:tellurite resistance protein
VTDAPGSRLKPVPLSLFAIPLGLSGLGGAWSGACLGGVAPRWPEEVLYAAAAIVWLAFSALYLLRGVRRPGTFGMDLRHPAAGPFAAYIPVVGILLTAHYATLVPWIGWLCVVFVAALAIVDAQLFAHWLTGPLDRDALSTGYFLPVVAGSFIASLGLSTVGAPGAAIAAFGVGLFFFLTLGAIVLARLFTGTPLAPPARPSLAILLAAPATGGTALFVAQGGHASLLQEGLAGVVAIMLLVQIVLVPAYREVPFTLGYWTFSFPLASVTNYTVRWMLADPFPGSIAIVWVVLGIATAFVLVLAAASLRLVTTTRGWRPAN